MTVTRQKSITKPPTVKPTLKKKRVVSPEVMEKGRIGLEKWRKAKAAAKLKGGKALQLWEIAEKLKKELKNTSPLQAIRNFCLQCVETRDDITNCTSYKCPIYIYRPYQESNET